MCKMEQRRRVASSSLTDLAPFRPQLFGTETVHANGMLLLQPLYNRLSSPIRCAQPNAPPSLSPPNAEHASPLFVLLDDVPTMATSSFSVASPAGAALRPMSLALRGSGLEVLAVGVCGRGVVPVWSCSLVGSLTS